MASFRLARSVPDFHCTYECTIADRASALEVTLEARPIFASDVIADLDAFSYAQFEAYLTTLHASYLPRIVHEVTRALRMAGCTSLPRLARPRGPPPLLPPYREQDLLYRPHGPWVSSFSGDATQRVERAQLVLPVAERSLEALATQVGRRLPGTLFVHGKNDS